MKDEKINKEHEMYKAALPAFFQNEFESDKLILGLSVAGIGFLISFIENLNNINLALTITFFVATIMFIITTIMILFVFYYNKKQLLIFIENTGGGDGIPMLDTLDKYKYIPFSIGMITSVLFGIFLINK